MANYRDAVLVGDRRQIPGAVRASTRIATTPTDVERFLAAVATVVAHPEPPIAYDQDQATGDYWPVTGAEGWTADDRHHSAPCGRG